jgi:hypothetical protein
VERQYRIETAQVCEIPRESNLKPPIDLDPPLPASLPFQAPAIQALLQILPGHKVLKQPESERLLRD